MESIFLVPVADRFLLYSPLHHLTALVDKHAARLVRADLHRQGITSESLAPIVRQLLSVPNGPPTVCTGKLEHPSFLGIIPTRNCNMGCRYCDFAAPKLDGKKMDWDTAKRAIKAYFHLLKASGRDYAEIHFFGGEPFFAIELVQLIREYATLRASDLQLNLHFEAITNGIFNDNNCKWIADNFDTIILSLDGPEDIQGEQRPARNGYNPFSTVVRNAKIFSEAAVELIIRVCVTHKTVERLKEISDWLGREFRPSTVCFETLTESPLSRTWGLLPPSPWEFARHFVNATRVLEKYGIEGVFSTANLQKVQSSFCPVGNDAIIVSPDGALNACYLLPGDWSRNSLNLCFGHILDDAFEIDVQALQQIRDLSMYNKALCSGCLCRYHCAGGCHVNHHPSRLHQYDDLCIETRLITIAKLLMQLKQNQLMEKWLSNQTLSQVSVMQPTDRIFDVELNQ